MANDPATTHPDLLMDYQLRLPGYEGPLDVLLRLIERNQLEIADVSLVAVTSQFFDHVAGMTEAPASVVAGFATVGTRLTVLKSRSLLPNPATPEENHEPSDLTRQLQEYRRARDAGAFLAGREQRDFRSWGRPVSRPADQALHRPAVSLRTYPASALVNALRRRLTLTPRPPRMVPTRKVVSLRETISHMLELTDLRRQVAFTDVIERYTTRTEVATAFLGMLVLIRRNVLGADQTDLFGTIQLNRTYNAEAQEPDHPDEQFESIASRH